MRRPAKAKALGADHVINYKTERFEGEVRKLTKRKGVDVVFEHVGCRYLERLAPLPETRRAARNLRIDSGISVSMKPDAAFPAAIPDFWLFACSMRNITESLEKMKGGMKPVIDSVFALENFAQGWSGLNRARSSARWWCGFNVSPHPYRLLPIWDLCC